jgi:YVTN family beta-propeller protein
VRRNGADTLGETRRLDRTDTCRPFVVWDTTTDMRRLGTRSVLFLLLGLGEPVGAVECAFVAASGQAAVVVLDIGRDRISGFLPVGERPVAVAVSNDGGRAWAANTDEHTVSVVDLATRRIVATVAVGFSPTDVAVHPDGQRVYVSDRGSNRLSVLDADTSRVIDTISTLGNGPAGIALTRDGRRAFVANSFSNTVVEIDLEDGRPLGVAAVGAYPFDVALTPDDARAYVSNAESGSVTVLRTADRSMITTIPVGGYPVGIAVHPNGSFAYAANSPVGSVSVIDTATNTLLTRIFLGPEENTELAAIALSADGATAFVAEFIFANLFAIDTGRSQVAHFTPVGGIFANPQGLTVTRFAGSCPVSPVPLLTMPVTASDTTIFLERADLLPASGTLRIEDELLTYEGQQVREAVLNARRGQRQTEASTHAVGTPARLVGQPGDANCDARTSAADLAALPSQAPDGWRPCGGDLDNDATVTETDRRLLIGEVFTAA